MVANEKLLLNANSLSLPQSLWSVFCMQSNGDYWLIFPFSPWQITHFQSNCYWRYYQLAEAASEPSARWGGGGGGEALCKIWPVYNYPPQQTHVLTHTFLVRFTIDSWCQKNFWPPRTENGMRIGERVRTREKWQNPVTKGKTLHHHASLEIIDTSGVVKGSHIWKKNVALPQHTCGCWGMLI